MQETTWIAKWVKLNDQPLDPNGSEYTLKRVVLGENETAEEGEDKIISSCVVEWSGQGRRAENLGLANWQQQADTARALLPSRP